MFKKIGKNFKYRFNTVRKHGKQDIVLLVFAIILVFITFSILFISTTHPTPIRNNTSSYPTVSLLSPTPVTFFDSTADSRLAEKIINRPSLTPQDTNAKSTTLTTILKGDNSGIVYKTSNISIEYVKSVDLFMAEILTTNIVLAKQEAATWFQNQGFSKQAVCDMPVMFYLDQNVASELSGKDIHFSPLAIGC